MEINAAADRCENADAVPFAGKWMVGGSFRLAGAIDYAEGGSDEAPALGIADELCEPGELVSRAVALAAELGAFHAYARVKGQVRGAQLAEMKELVARDPMLEHWVH